MLTLVEGGDVYAPEPIGRTSLLIANGVIVKVGAVDRRHLDQLGVEYDYVNAAGKLVTPGLLDPHQHLCGGSGEGGFSSESPRIFLEEIVTAGITSVVGTLGVDTTTTVMPALLARAKALREQGLSAYLYTGGYNVPPTTITQSVRHDLLLIDEVIGVGEIAISDSRSMDPAPFELAKIISDAHVGGIISGKAGISHLHVGPREKRLSLVRKLLDEFDVQPEWLYPTHVERNEALMDEALELVRRGVTFDIDVIEKDLAKWLKYYLQHGGNRERLTVSSDSFLTGPHNLLSQFRECIVEHHFALEEILPFVTVNTANILQLPHKGRLRAQCDGDVLILEPGSLQLLDVIARGRRLLSDGRLLARERFLQESDRVIQLIGQKK